MPQTKVHIEAIAAAKAAGQFFHATGGSHLNYDDYFKSRVLIQRKEQIKELEKEKEDVFNITEYKYSLCNKSYV